MPRCLTILVLVASHALAQTPTPPGQPARGPGGSAYTYPSYQRLGPYYVNAQAPSSEYYIFEPADSTPPASLPVVLFLHGYLLKSEGYPRGDEPQNYSYWIQHLVRKGYTVVFPTYDYDLGPSHFSESIIQSWQAALVLLQSGGANLIPPTVDALGIQTVCTGHSMGAYECFATGQQLSLSPVAGIPLPRAIAAFTPGIAQTGLSTDFSRISPTISVVLVDGDEDTPDIPTADAIWSSIQTAIPSANRDFLKVVSDSHGSPAQVGNHWFPDTNGFMDDDSGVDDRDYNVTWKLSAGIFDCVLIGTNCAFGLGHGAIDQINMGDWSDNTPVTPLKLQD
jgi:hypothetical protein